METVVRFNSIINEFVWGPLLVCFFVGAGLYLSVLLGFPQLRYFRMAFWSVLHGARGHHRGAYDRSISSFAAMTTALAATIGTGNIAGVATAIHLGGPGAIIWMLFSAFFGMCTKFSEVALAVHFRKKDDHGDWRGGTMYILEHGAGSKWLAFLFAVFTVISALGSGAAVQSNSVAEGLRIGFNLPRVYCGTILSILTGLVIIGGIKSLSAVATYLVPFMAVFYVGSSLAVIAYNITSIPGAIAVAVERALYDPMAVPGAIAGWSVKQAISKGIARGVFSNEAGLGSAPMVHSTADVDHPVRQGLYGIFEVFVDTFVICTVTALMILCTGSLTGHPDLTGSQLALMAFESCMGPMGKYILSILITLFAYSTILGWYWYAETSMTYLFGIWCKPVFKLSWIAMIVIGSSGGDLFGTSANDFLDILWSMSDTLNGLMAIPNIIGLLMLSKILRELVNEFDEKRKNGELSA
ncbi:MAG: sodium:alanine symporter family protein [Synergistaceae bacterium]|jgi:AGCS family alanine or glycine:cation symporter|nr:sodium:alanine symporter family protein [Synergistaceae bacterium]